MDEISRQEIVKKFQALNFTQKIFKNIFQLHVELIKNPNNKKSNFELTVLWIKVSYFIRKREKKEIKIVNKNIQINIANTNECKCSNFKIKK